MAKTFETEEERIKHENKIRGYLSIGGFLAAFLIGYFYGFQYAAIIAAVATLLIAFKQANIRETFFRQTYALASPYMAIIAVGIINPMVIPVGVAGVVFTMLGLYLVSSVMSPPVKGLLVAVLLGTTSWASLTYYPTMMRDVLSEKTMQPLGDFEITSVDGRQVKLSDLHGKVVIMDFWATWCRPCIAELAELEKVYAQYKDRDDVVFLITNAKGSGDTVEKVQQFVKDKQIALPFYMDLTGHASHAVNVSSFPTLAFIDKEGVMRIKHTGFSQGENLPEYVAEEIERLLAE